MNKTKKWLIAALSAVFAVCMIAFAACQTGEKSVTFMDGDTVYTTVKGKAGEEIEPLNLPSKTGYEFTGWQTANGEEYIPDTIPAKNLTVYAAYTANPYKIVLNPNGGTGNAVSLDAVYDTAVNIPEVGFAKNGYDLTGWSKTKNADAAEYGVRDSLKNLTAVKNETVTLYAVWHAEGNAEGFVIEGTEVVAYVGTDASVTLPDSCTAIGAGAFADNHTLTEVVIPDTYTEIGFGAFEGCDNLEKITVPFIGGSLTENRFLAYIFGAATYKDNTFAYELTDIGTGDSEVNESSLTGSFYIPRSLRIVIINSDITEIPEGAFYYAFGLEKVMAYRFTDDEKPDSNSKYTYRIKTVGDSAFEGCHRIGYDTKANTEYYMAWLSGVETFGKACFKGYIATNDYFTGKLFTLGELTNVKTIGDEAFRYNTTLCDFTFGNQLESIGKEAFTNISLMQRVVIPDSCVSIGESAFEQCIYLGSVTIGSGVKTIGEHAFAYSAALTEVFFKGGLPENLAANAFCGLDLDSATDRLRTDVNPGTVMYFKDGATATAAETTLKAHYPSVKTGVTQAERGPLYYVGQSYDFMMTFSGGHTILISDPLYRIGFGLPEVVATYERKTDVWYDAEIYTVTVMLDIEFTAKIEYYLSAKHTHYYIYRVETFTFDQVRDEVTAFTVGNKETDEWYLEENVYSQIGLWHNGQMVELDKSKGATYAVGGISQYYDDRGMRTMVYRQGNEYFESVLEYDFIYVPREGTKDDLLTYYGTLYLDDTEQNMLFGTYESGDKKYEVFVDEVISKIKISLDGEELINGTYTTTSVYKDEKFTLSVVDGSKTVTVTFTDFLDNIVDGNNKRSFYARCNFTLDGEKHVVYNKNYSSYNNCYYIGNNGKPSADRYVLMQYHQRIEEGEGDTAYEYEVYPGFGEHWYSANGASKHDYLTYNYTEGEQGFVYQFVIDNGEPDPDKQPIKGPDGELTYQFDYIGTVTDSFVGTFRAKVPGTEIERPYTPYFEDEDNKTFTNGKVSIKLSGYGTAEYTDENGTVISGKYNIESDTVVKQVYITVNSYINLLEYKFISNDGETELYFVPNFYDAYDGSMFAGEMLLPDESRDKSYRIYDNDGWCTAQFASSGYGMGVLYIMIDPETALVTPIDSYFFAPGATYGYYTQIGEKDGKPLYRMTNGMDKGFFTFQFTDRLTNGHRPGNLSNSFARDMAVDYEYNIWWQGPAAKNVTGDISPELDEMERMVAREEMGVYTAPNGYTLTLDGIGTANLKKPDGTLIHTAEYTSIDENVLGATKFPLEYKVDGTTYKGTIDIIDAEKRDSAIISLEFTVDGVVINNFVKGVADNYTAESGTTDYGTLSLYAGENVGEYKIASGKAVFNLGSYEYDEKSGNYIFRFTDKKLIVTLDKTTHKYTVVNAYSAIQVKVGDYECKAYYKWSEKDKIIDDDGNETEEVWPKTTLYGYEVRANGLGKPMVNYQSEYRGTSIQTKDNKYFYMNKAYDAEIICYEDGEFSLTYNHLDIIKITSTGKYYAADDPENNEKDAIIVLDKGTAICVYVCGSLGVG